MKYKKGVVDKIFIYIFSIIIIGFVGFLVAQFVDTFSDDVDLRLQTEFYEKLEKDYTLVYKTYGAEKTLKYKVHSDVKYVCFVPSVNCLSQISFIEEDISNFDFESLETLIEAGHNVIMYDRNDVMNKGELGVYNDENTCFCVKPNLGRFDLIIENMKNNVYISESK